MKASGSFGNLTPHHLHMKRILHDDLLFHSYKLILVQEQSAANYGNHKNLAGNALAILLIAIFFCNDEVHFFGTVNKQNFQYWLKIPHSSFMKDHSTLKVTM